MARIIEKCVHGRRIIGDCSKCKAIYGQQRRKDFPEKYIWYSAKMRAKKQGAFFNLSVSDVVIPLTCPVLGIPIDWRDRDHAASIDEIVQGRGYTPENTCVISGRANRIKSDSTLLELQALVAYVKIRSSEKYGKW